MSVLWEHLAQFNREPPNVQSASHKDMPRSGNGFAVLCPVNAATDAAVRRNADLMKERFEAGMAFSAVVETPPTTSHPSDAPEGEIAVSVPQAIMSGLNSFADNVRPADLVVVYLCSSTAIDPHVVVSSLQRYPTVLPVCVVVFDCPALLPFNVQAVTAPDRRAVVVPPMLMPREYFDGHLTQKLLHAMLDLGDQGRLTTLASLAAVITDTSILINGQSRSASASWSNVPPTSIDRATFIACLSQTIARDDSSHAVVVPDGRTVGGNLKRVIPQAKIRLVIEKSTAIIISFTPDKAAAMTVDRAQLILDDACASCNLEAPAVTFVSHDGRVHFAISQDQMFLIDSLLNGSLVLKDPDTSAAMRWIYLGASFKFEVVTSYREFLLMDAISRVHVGSSTNEPWRTVIVEELGLAVVVSASPRAAPPAEQPRATVEPQQAQSAPQQAASTPTVRFADQGTNSSAQQSQGSQPPRTNPPTTASQPSQPQAAQQPAPAQRSATPPSAHPARTASPGPQQSSTVAQAPPPQTVTPSAPPQQPAAPSAASPAAVVQPAPQTVQPAPQTVQPAPQPAVQYAPPPPAAPAAPTPELLTMLRLMIDDKVREAVAAERAENQRQLADLQRQHDAHLVAVRGELSRQMQVEVESRERALAKFRDELVDMRGKAADHALVERALEDVRSQMTALRNQSAQTFDGLGRQLSEVDSTARASKSDMGTVITAVDHHETVLQQHKTLLLSLEQRQEATAASFSQLNEFVDAIRDLSARVKVVEVAIDRLYNGTSSDIGTLAQKLVQVEGLATRAADAAVAAQQQAAQQSLSGALGREVEAIASSAANGAVAAGMEHLHRRCERIDEAVSQLKQATDHVARRTDALQSDVALTQKTATAAAEDAVRAATAAQTKSHQDAASGKSDMKLAEMENAIVALHAKTSQLASSVNPLSEEIRALRAAAASSTSPAAPVTAASSVDGGQVAQLGADVRDLRTRVQKLEISNASVQHVIDMDHERENTLHDMDRRLDALESGLHAVKASTGATLARQQSSRAY